MHGDQEFSEGGSEARGGYPKADTGYRRVSGSNSGEIGSILRWDIDWLWSLPLIAICVIIHVVGLMPIFREVVNTMNIATARRRFVPMFIAVIGRAALLATVLHGLEAGLWAVAYRGLDALPDSRSAMLYSLSAMSSYGHANLYLRDQWQLMGAFEALNGMLLFGLTTASLFAMIREVWDMERRERHQASKL